MAGSYKELLKTESESGVNATLTTVEDGDGTSSALQISNSGVKSSGFLISEGATELNSTLTVSGNVTAQSDATVLGNVAIIGNTATQGGLDVGGNLTVSGSAVIQGTLTANGGNLVLGNDDSDNLVFGAEVNSHIIPNVDDTYDLGTATKEWRNLYIDGTAEIDTLNAGVFAVSGLQSITATTESTNKDTGALVVEGGVGIEKNANIGGNLGVTGNITSTGNLAVDGGGITTSAATFNLLNSTATTVNFAGAATSLSIGTVSGSSTHNIATGIPSSGTTKTVNFGTGGSAGSTTNIVIGNSFGGSLGLYSPTVVGALATQNLFNTVATTINFAGAATALNMGAASGTLTIGNPTITGTNATALNLNGASPSIATSNTGTASVFNTNATTLNLGGAATTISLGNTTSLGQTLNVGTASTGASTYNIGTGSTAASTTKTLNLGTGGAASSTTNVNIGSSNGGTTTINSGTLVGASATQSLFNTTATTLNLGGAATSLNFGAATGTLTIANPTITGTNATTLNLNGASPSILTSSTGTASVFNTNALTGNLFGAATSISIGAATGTTTINHGLTVAGGTGQSFIVNDGTTNRFTVDSTNGNTSISGTLGVTGNSTLSGNLTVSGDLTVNGTTTNINTTNLVVEDKNVILGDVTTPTNTTADGGGITLKGTTDKSFNWVNSTGAWTSSEDLDLASGKVYEINGATVLSASALGSGIVGSSLTSVGTIGTGTWQGSVVAGQYGGTGVNNSGKTITLGGNLTTSGAHSTTLTTSGNTSLSLPTAGTLATLAGTETLTNKTLTSPVIGTIVNTGTLTLPTSTDTLVGRATTDTLTNKTLTSPVIGTIVNTGTLTLPTSTDTLVGRATTDTLTNKTINLASNTLTATSAQIAAAVTDETGSGALVFGSSPTLTTPSISSIVNTGTLTLPTSTDTLVGRATTDTLTNKSINLTNNTLTATSAQIAAAVTDETGSGALVFGTSPTLTTPNIASIVNTGTLTLPTSTDTLIGRATTDTLTNKTINLASNTLTTTSSQLAAAVTDETGSGALVFANSPTLISPNLGTPSSGNLSSCTSLPVSTGISGLGTGVAAFLGVPSSSNLALAVTDETGSGALVFANSPTLSTPNISSITNTGTLTLPTTTDTLVGRATTDTLTNKTLTSPTINNGSLNMGAGTVVLPSSASPAQTGEGSVVWDSDDDLLTVGTGAGRKTMVDTDSTQTLTNKTLTSPTISALTLSTPLGITSGGTGVSSSPTNGQVLIGNGTGFNLATLSAGSNVSITNGPGSITISSTGGGGGGGPEFSDDVFRVIDDLDTSKKVAFQCSGITAGNTRVLTAPDANGTLVLEGATQTLTNKTLTSPTLTSPTLGVASATSINKLTITAPATSATLTVADGKTLTANNTLTLTGTDSSSVAFGAGGTVAYTGNKLSAFASTTSSELAGVISDETGSGALVFATSPSLTTPTIGSGGANFSGTTGTTNLRASAAASGVITLPAVTGTVITSADTGTVTGTMIADGTIVDGDINASAAISHSKLASITAGRVLLGNATNVPTATALSGDVTVNSSGATTVSSGAITTAKIANSAVDSSKVNTTSVAVLGTAQGYTRTHNFNATSLNDTANISWSLPENQVASVILQGNRTLDNPTGQVNGAVYILMVIQDGVGGKTLSFSSSYRFPNNEAPVLSTGANKRDIFTFVSDGTYMYGVSVLNY
ncbi:MAG: hypothetical protein EBS53_00860 [Bacteroidetes bacterium]|nr:hypothetical protein [Bacteroidota bacterium]